MGVGWWNMCEGRWGYGKPLGHGRSVNRSKFKTVRVTKNALTDALAEEREEREEREARGRKLTTDCRNREERARGQWEEEGG